MYLFEVPAHVLHELVKGEDLVTSLSKKLNYKKFTPQVRPVSLNGVLCCPTRRARIARRRLTDSGLHLNHYRSGSYSWTFALCLQTFKLYKDSNVLKIPTYTNQDTAHNIYKEKTMCYITLILLTSDRYRTNKEYNCVIRY